MVDAIRVDFKGLTCNGCGAKFDIVSTLGPCRLCNECAEVLRLFAIGSSDELPDNLRRLLL